MRVQGRTESARLGPTCHSTKLAWKEQHERSRFRMSPERSGPYDLLQVPPRDLQDVWRRFSEAPAGVGGDAGAIHGPEEARCRRCGGGWFICS